eukprot:CAMPEP_0206585046 /NCGR_PEP_ID=MMETSP0325_2-20121206/36163_1 /ASSEMBLY_ACC=CAM_ASM_000347 /TAXON_ID=2866 /ORGANISM="Crypthecodinium cohnii, Strain Seligo" /LENGTH=723 /DNA_ID=CAMNT_0054092477 /DNA_START=186 /DNA_END=2353 /DNA_ORIENTATION=-
MLRRCAARGSAAQPRPTSSAKAKTIEKGTVAVFYVSAPRALVARLPRQGEHSLRRSESSWSWASAPSIASCRRFSSDDKPSNLKRDDGTLPTERARGDTSAAVDVEESAKQQATAESPPDPAKKRKRKTSEVAAEVAASVVPSDAAARAASGAQRSMDEPTFYEDESADGTRSNNSTTTTTTAASTSTSSSSVADMSTHQASESTLEVGTSNSGGSSSSSRTNANTTNDASPSVQHLEDAARMSSAASPSQPASSSSSSPSSSIPSSSSPSSSSSSSPSSSSSSASSSAHPASAGTPDEGDGKGKPGWDRRLVRDVGILSVSQLMLNMGFSQIVPVIPLFVAQMGGEMSSTGVGLVMAAPSAAMFALNVPMGRLCDTIGRKPLMYIGMSMTALGTFLSGFSTTLPQLIVCRLLVGAGVCTSSTGSSAYMADLTDRAPQHRAKIMGLNSAIAGSVWVVGPAVGGWLAETYGFQNSFFIGAAGAAMCSLGYLGLPETLAKGVEHGQKGKALDEKVNLTKGMSIRGKLNHHLSDWWSDLKPLLKSGNQQALVALSAVPSLRWSCFSSVVTLYAATTLGAGPKEIGLMFTALALSQGVAMPFGAYLADRTTGTKMALVMPAGVVSCLAFASVGFATSLDQFLAAMAVQGFCAGFTVPAHGAFRAEVTPQALRGQAMSLERQAGSIISLAGPVTMGVLADVMGGQASIFMTAILMAGCHVLYMIKARP